MTDVLELVRACDPKPDGASTPSIEPLLTRIQAAEAAPDTAGPAPRRDAGRIASRSRRRATLGVAVGGVAAVVVALAIAPGGDHLNVVARAEAAIAGGDMIVHTVTRTVFRDAAGTTTAPIVRGNEPAEGGEIGTTERWSTNAPTRWRSVLHIAPGQGRSGGTSESAYDSGVVRQRTSWSPEITALRLQAPEPEWPGRDLSAGTADPLTAVRAMLASGEVREAGERSYDGRRVLALVHEPADPSDPDSPAASATTSLRVMYLLDPETYAPVSITTWATDGSSVETIYERYEQLPINAENAKLLRLG